MSFLNSVASLFGAGKTATVNAPTIPAAQQALQTEQSGILNPVAAATTANVGTSQNLLTAAQGNLTQALPALLNALGYSATVGENGAITGIQPGATSTDVTTATQAGVVAAAQKQLTGILGGGTTNPLLEQQITLAKQEMDQQFASQYGQNYQNTTEYQDALNKFNLNSTAQRTQWAQGMEATASGAVATQTGTLQSDIAQNVQRATGLATTPTNIGFGNVDNAQNVLSSAAGISGAFTNAQQPYMAQNQLLFNASQANAAAQNQATMFGASNILEIGGAAASVGAGAPPGIASGGGGAPPGLLASYSPGSSVPNYSLGNAPVSASGVTL